MVVKGPIDCAWHSNDDNEGGSISSLEDIIMKAFSPLFIEMNISASVL